MLDGGTGLRRLTKFLDGRPFKGTILVGHLHWDHTHGLPFFRSGDRAESRVNLYIPEQGDASEVMARVVAPPHFPVRLEDLNGSWSLKGLEPGEHTFEGFNVTALDIPHKMSRTFGFRVSDGKATIAYMSDHWPAALGPGADGLGEIHASARALARDVDLLIHDAQYTAEEYPARQHFGHAAMEYAVALAEEAGARAVMLFHHDPDRTDDDLDRILSSLRNGKVKVSAAVEGTILSLPQ